MDFRVMVFGLLFWLPTAFGNPMKQMDELVLLINQYPKQAQDQINKIESTQTTATPVYEQLRLQLLKCKTLAALGDNQAAINLAKLYEAKSKQVNVNDVRPYFLLCMAESYLQLGNINEALPLFDTVINMAKEKEQFQALSSALRMRGDFEISAGNYASALEDLRFAIDVLSLNFTQNNNWVWEPETFFYISLSHLFNMTGDLDKSISYIHKALATDELEGKIHYLALIGAARKYFDNNQLELSQSYVEEAKKIVPELEGELDIAWSYATLGGMEFNLGNLHEAQKRLKLALMYFERGYQLGYTLRVKRLLAQVHFGLNEAHKAIPMMKEIISQAKELKLHHDLLEFYEILAKHYASTGDYESAYNYKVKSYAATAKYNEQTSNARFIQYKARLDRQASIHNQPNTQIVTHSQRLLTTNQTITIILFVLGVVGLLIGLVFYFQKKQLRSIENQNVNSVDSVELRATNMLLKAKQYNYSVTALVTKLNSLSDTEKTQVLEAIHDVLREGDLLLQHDSDEWVVLLPKVNNVAGYKIIRQITHSLPSTLMKQTFGLSTFKSFDNLDSLVKRAYLERLSQIKRREVKDDSNHPIAM
ncbi:hypothetical protein D5018_14645 [Parashewanella curva]|uniref:Uncharacterized protein n=1 Tax=Parashewanella curva TaxID=2338552 RepID=A0A3L8PUG4_9GAMM|nr:hypothetical protein [Parashewanella curva]RLV58956.1 hypothetical protein D5018_14645 [Parashewanella curva]